MPIDYSVTLLFYVEGEPLPGFAESLAQRAGAISIFPDGQSFEITLTITGNVDDYDKYMNEFAFAIDHAVDEIYGIAQLLLDDSHPWDWATSMIQILSAHAYRSTEDGLIESILKGENDDRERVPQSND